MTSSPAMISAGRQAVRTSRLPRAIAALMVVLGLGARAAQPVGPLDAASAGQPSGALIGRWQGEQDGPVITQLTLRGSLRGGSGHYDITTLTHSSGSHGSRYEPWSGRWVRVTEEIAGRPQTVIRLQGALNDEIDRYILDSAGILEPTPDYVGRPLSKEEIALYSLTPVRLD